MQRFRQVADGQGGMPARSVKQDRSARVSPRARVKTRRSPHLRVAWQLALGAGVVSGCADEPDRRVPFEVTVGPGVVGPEDDDTEADEPDTSEGSSESGDAFGSTGGEETTGRRPETNGAATSGASSGDDESGESSTTAAVGPDAGMMRVLSYNVAGLPDFISGSNPQINTPLMSPRLNEFDLVLAQEDFSYHAQLAADAQHPYQSTPGGGGTLGDGLNRFSEFAFDDFQRIGWTQCNGLVDAGSDCLTEKGFSVGLHDLGSGAEVDVYNLHMDAGGSQADIAARQAQIQQLLGTISTRSANRAIIVAGDTNMDEEDEPDFVTLLQGAGLTDACRELACGDEYRIDRIMFRNSADVELLPISWEVDWSFTDANGEQLSDHEAVVVEFDWATP